MLNWLKELLNHAIWFNMHWRQDRVYVRVRRLSQNTGVHFEFTMESMFPIYLNFSLHQSEYILKIKELETKTWILNLDSCIIVISFFYSHYIAVNRKTKTKALSLLQNTSLMRRIAVPFIYWVLLCYNSWKLAHSEVDKQCPSQLLYVC